MGTKITSDHATHCSPLPRGVALHLPLPLPSPSPPLHPHLELVGAREAFAAVDPAADEGSLAAVPAQVGAQVGRLAVHLVTARDVADVHALLVRVGVYHFAERGKGVVTLLTDHVARLKKKGNSSGLFLALCIDIFYRQRNLYADFQPVRRLTN